MTDPESLLHKWSCDNSPSWDDGVVRVGKLGDLWRLAVAEERARIVAYLEGTASLGEYAHCRTIIQSLAGSISVGMHTIDPAPPTDKKRDDR